MPAENDGEMSWQAEAEPGPGIPGFTGGPAHKHAHHEPERAISKDQAATCAPWSRGLSRCSRPRATCLSAPTARPMPPWPDWAVYIYFMMHSQTRTALVSVTADTAPQMTSRSGGLSSSPP